MEIVNVIKFFDILSPKPSLTVNRSDRFKTILGGIFSLLLILLSVVAFGWFFALLIQKSEFTVISNNSFNTTLEFSFKSEDRLIMFNALTNRGFKINEQNRIFNISAVNIKYTFNKTSNGDILVNSANTPLQIIECNREILSKFIDYLTQINLTLYYCLAPNQTVYLQNTPQSTDFYSYLNVYYSPCVNSSLNNNSCFDSETIADTMKLFHNRVVTLNTYFDNNNETQPEQLSATPTYDPSSSAFYSQKYFYFQKYNYSSDNGLVFANYKNYINLTSFGATYAIAQQSNKTFVPYAFFVNVFQLQPILLNINRTYKKAQTMIGEIGGFVNFVFLILGIIISYISPKELHYHIFKGTTLFIDTKEIKKQKFLSINRVVFKPIKSENNKIVNIENECEIKLSSVTESNKARIEHNPLVATEKKIRRSQVDHTSNYYQYLGIDNILNFQNIDLKYIDYFLITTFSCYKKNQKIRSYHEFIAKKILKSLDIGQMINIQNKLNHVNTVLFQKEKRIFNRFSRILVYSQDVVKNSIEPPLIQMNSNKNFGIFLNNIKMKINS